MTTKQYLVCPLCEVEYDPEADMFRVVRPCRSSTCLFYLPKRVRGAE